MSDPATPAAEIVELGVVEPIGLPRWARRPLDRLSRLARAFVALAVVDVVARVTGFFGPPIEFFVAGPLVAIAWLLPRALWILLPAILLYRRPDAARTTPWILRGAIVLSLTTALAEPLSRLVEGAALSPVDGTASIPSIAVTAASGLLTTAAWAMIASGFVALRRRPAAAVARRLSKLVALAFVLNAAVGWYGAVQNTGTWDFMPGGAATAVALNLLATLGGLATGLALSVIVRGLGDPLRPRRAVRLAVAGATVWSIATALVALVVLSFVLAQPVSNEQSGQGLIDVLGLLGWASYVIGPTMLVGAFGIGLADADLAPKEPPNG